MQQAHLSLCPVCPEYPENRRGNTEEWSGKVVSKLDEHLEPAPWHIQAIGALRQPHGSDGIEKSCIRLDLRVSSPLDQKIFFSFLEFTFLLHDPLLIGITAVKLLSSANPAGYAHRDNPSATVLSLQGLYTTSMWYRLKNSCHRPRLPKGPERVQRSSLYQLSKDLWSVYTVTFRPPIKLLNFSKQETNA